MVMSAGGDDVRSVNRILRRSGPSGDFESLLDARAFMTEYHSEKQILGRKIDELVGSFPVNVRKRYRAISGPLEAAHEDLREAAGMAFAHNDDAPCPAETLRREVDGLLIDLAARELSALISPSMTDCSIVWPAARSTRLRTF